MANLKFGWVLGGLVASGAALGLVYARVIRPWQNRWGATPGELQQSLPYAELAPHPRMVATRAITLQAPAAQVWPWLAQLGCQRGGWYSYDWLDNGGKPSANHILPEFQNLQVGDHLAMTPDGKMAMPVAGLESGRLLVLGGTIDTSTGGGGDINDPNLKNYFNWTITIVLEPIDAGTTRLIVRNRAGWNSSLLNDVVYGYIVGLASFVMERKMLLNIKRRAERLARAASLVPAG